MNRLIGALAIMLLTTGCACSRETKKEAVLRKALALTRLRHDYSISQNERYSRQLAYVYDQNTRYRRQIKTLKDGPKKK
jgi:hypothetical protein